MKIIETRNVHQALPHGLWLLNQFGVQRASRYGDVIVAPWPVTTIYRNPMERVMFWPERDANPFFHLYESLWMIMGRNDVAGLAKYAKRMATFSDDGDTFHGAYGHRWRKHFTDMTDGLQNLDQLSTIVRRLKQDPDDRRCVLQMWDAEFDLDRVGKDVPCNTMATFQRDPSGKLNLDVFCRSNDIIWGCYGANAVHFSFLLEYVALGIGCEIGVYRQHSMNWHAYTNVLGTVDALRPRGIFAIPESHDDPYVDGSVRPMRMAIDGDFERVTRLIKTLVSESDNDFTSGIPIETFCWAGMAYSMLKAHWHFRQTHDPDRYHKAIECLSKADHRNDWVAAGLQWLTRRRLAAEAKR